MAVCGSCSSYQQLLCLNVVEQFEKCQQSCLLLYVPVVGWPYMLDVISSEPFAV